MPKITLGIMGLHELRIEETFVFLWRFRKDSTLSEELFYSRAHALF